jgi:hypothetical protein
MKMAVLGKDLARVTDDVAERPGQEAGYRLDSSKARQAFGWPSEIRLEGDRRLDRSDLG